HSPLYCRVFDENHGTPVCRNKVPGELRKLIILRVGGNLARKLSCRTVGFYLLKPKLSSKLDFVAFCNQIVFQASLIFFADVELPHAHKNRNERKDRRRDSEAHIPTSFRGLGHTELPSPGDTGTPYHP